MMRTDSMRVDHRARDLVVVIPPLGLVNPDVVVSACRAGALGVLDLGSHPSAAAAAVDRVATRWPGSFGLRVDPLSAVTVTDIVQCSRRAGAGRIDTLVISAGDGVAEMDRWLGAEDWGGCHPRVVVEVTSVTEARDAVAAGAQGVIAKGSEAGGLVGGETAFILLQAVADAVDVPVWSAGGIGLYTAAAAVVGGATGVVLDIQMALTPEVSVPADLRTALAAMDGSETTVAGGYRFYTRPDLPAASVHSAADRSEVAARIGGADLHEGLVAVGQDGFLARRLADRYRTVGGIVQAVRRSIEDSIAGARRQRALAPGSGMARELGTRYPIAQGPMTRVSDRPAFAAAVAEGGGLPFLALALMREGEVRSLLRETAEVLGDRPWGAGILGFVPPELREEQMAVLLEQPPPVALIAGGRPSQARPLEEAGTAVFLHVPSPGLLDRFLADGARRFVFEGRECGGHVGPRTSYALWEAQIGRMLAFDRPEELRVLFAGGIHDARSAAMVAAMSAELVERGAAIGTLMGTAYLLTEESVSTGAIQPGFQQAALEASHTVLLETSPGHATRCVDSDFVRTFADERRRLAEAGASSHEMWAALETLNLGRLRIASKGLRRDGDDIGTVSPDEQRHEGMFMMGQVAALRTETMTVADLHRDVSDGSSLLLGRPTAADRPTDPSDIDRGAATARRGRVAIIGMSGIFPDADGTDRFWANVVGGANAITEVPPERWDVDTYYDPDSFTNGAGRRTPSKWGGFLPEVGFDALAYGIPPTSLASIEPVQLLSLESAARALADAGYAGREFDRESVSVIFGAEAGTDLASAYGFRAMYPQTVGPLPDALEATLPSLTEDSFPGVLTNVIAGRIANRLDLGGVNYTIDAACASSLAAVDMACKELAAGTSDMVLCGGADLHNGVNDYLLFAGVHALSPTGQCRSFDADADGIALGEGVACVVLKRLEDAERDGDRIYAVIDGIAGSSDGRSLGLTAPRPEGQRRALERAYRRAGVSPSEVGLVEAHGTGTVVGDRTELATLNEVFLEAGAQVGSVALGSVKSQIGHTKCAAGMAGLIKAALALHSGVRPPTLNMTRPNPGYEATTSPFVFSATARPWASGTRVAGVSAFGFGGTNFHVVLSAHDGQDLPPHGLDQWPAELFLFRGSDRSQAVDQVRRLRSLVDAVADRAAIRLRDLAATAAGWDRRRASGEQPDVQVAVVASSLDDLCTKLDVVEAGGSGTDGVFVAAAARDGTPAPAEAGGVSVAGGAPVAFVYPGQGSQRPGMLADLFVAFPPLQRFLRMGAPWVDRMYPPTAFTADERTSQRDALTDTRVAQPALGIAGLAVTELLAECGVRPSATAGHSYGELVALAVAGVLPEDDLLGLSETRGRVILGATDGDPGTMVAVASSADRVGAVLGSLPAGQASGVVVANDNSPNQVVLSGPSVAIREAVAALESAGVASRDIPVACAFHSPVVAGAEHAFAEILASLDIRPPDIPVFANTTAAPYPSDPAAIRALLASQLARPVRFREQVEAMYASGVRVFVEAGSGRVLTQLIGKILGDRPHAAIACDVPGDGGVRQLLLALGRLATLGVPVDTRRLFDGRATSLDESALGKRPGWTVNGHLVRTAAGSVVPGGLLPAQETGLPFGSAATGAPSSGAFANGVPGIGAAARAQVVGGAGPVGVGGGAGPVGTFASGQAPSDRDLAVLTYLQSMREMVEAQRDVFVRYLGGPATASGTLPSVVPIEVAVTDGLRTAAQSATVPSRTTPTVTVVADGATQVADHATSAPSPADVMSLLLSLVAERTGYPLDMLGPDLDLEADLSIDSIKRLEIIGELASRAGLAGPVGSGGTGSDAAGPGGSLDESIVEELVTQKSLRSIVEWIDTHLSTGSAGVSADPGGGGSGDNGTRVNAGDGVGDAVRGGRAPVPVPSLLSGDALMSLLLSLVAERTGYPLDMLGPDLDLEADLSIDSIKRLEIIGELASRAGLAGPVGSGGTGSDAAGPGGSLDESIVEELVTQKSLRSIVEWIDTHLSTGSAGVSAGEGAEDAGSSDIPERSVRAVFRVVPSPNDVTSGASLSGSVFVVVDDRSGVAPLVVDGLERLGARAQVVARTPRADGAGVADGIVHLSLAAPDGETAADVFDRVRPFALADARFLVAVTGLGGSSGRGPRGAVPIANSSLTGNDSGAAPADRAATALRLGAGVAGLWKSLAREFPSAHVRAVDLDPSVAPEVLATQIIAEVSALGGPVAVGYRGSERVTVVAVEEEHQNEPAGRPAAGDRPVLGPESVVLLTGGARGITARLAVALARSSGCSLELVGRSPLPDAPEDADVALAGDAAALRRVLIARGMREPAMIEAECARLLVAREVRATLAALEEAGVKVSYQVADVRNRGALSAVVEDVRSRHGRLDGVVHGAGVIEDRHLADKTSESFRRVFDTKVAGAQALLSALHDDQAFVVFFTSVSGAFGNAGQVDYSAANDALATLAWALAEGRSLRSGRVVAVDWGPWAGTGMVSAELERAYNRRGVGLVDAGDGIARLLAELAAPAGEPEIVVARARMTAFSAADVDAAHRGVA